MIFMGSPIAWAAPQISKLLKPEVYQRVLENREILTHASLDELPVEKPKKGQNLPQKKDPLKKYEFYATMLVRTHSRRAREVLTDYPIYPKMIPYVETADYDPKLKRLKLKGGVLGFGLQSTLQFEEKEPGWISFKIIEGHFKGMDGQVLFEERGEAGTLVYLAGEAIGSQWPPAWIVERGAEIVFGFTGQRMRSYLESPEKKGEPPNDPKFPQPRSRIPKGQ